MESDKMLEDYLADPADEEDFARLEDDGGVVAPPLLHSENAIIEEDEDEQDDREG